MEYNTFVKNTKYKILLIFSVLILFVTHNSYAKNGKDSIKEILLNSETSQQAIAMISDSMTNPIFDTLLKIDEIENYLTKEELESIHLAVNEGLQESIQNIVQDSDINLETFDSILSNVSESLFDIAIGKLKEINNDALRSNKINSITYHSVSIALDHSKTVFYVAQKDYQSALKNAWNEATESWETLGIEIAKFNIAQNQLERSENIGENLDRLLLLINRYKASPPNSDLEREAWNELEIFLKQEYAFNDEQLFEQVSSIRAGKIIHLKKKLDNNQSPEIMIEYLAIMESGEDVLFKIKTELESSIVADGGIVPSIGHNTGDPNKEIGDNEDREGVIGEAESPNIPLDNQYSYITTGGDYGYNSVETVNSYSVKNGDTLNDVIGSGAVQLKLNVQTTTGDKILDTITTTPTTNDGTRQFQYVGWGEYIGTGKTFVAPWDSQTKTVQHGYYTIGIPTNHYPDGGSYPKTATYNGSIQGDYANNTGGNIAGAVSGTVTLNADFTNNSIGGQMNVNVNNTPWETTTFNNINFSQQENSFHGNMTITGGGTGQIAGGFSGQNAEESAGGFFINKNNGEGVSGIYRAKR